MTEKEALKRVKEIKEFYAHLSSYIAVIGGLFILNYFTSPGHLWAVYPMAGWGIGLLGHAASVFPFFGYKGKDWEKKKVKQLMAADQEPLSMTRLENMLEERISSSKFSGDADPAMKNLIQRVQHLETIITSADWEHVPTMKERLGDTLNPPEPISNEEKVAKLAKKVR